MNTRLRHVIVPLFALAVLLLALGARAAGPLQFAGKLLAGDGSARDNFGYALDADGDTAVAGAVRWNNPDDSNSDYQGAAYVFTRAGGGWTERKQLTLADGMGYEGFGGALALDGDTLAVGRSASTYRRPIGSSTPGPSSSTPARARRGANRSSSCPAIWSKTISLAWPWP